VDHPQQLALHQKAPGIHCAAFQHRQSVSLHYQVQYPQIYYRQHLPAAQPAQACSSPLCTGLILGFLRLTIRLKPM
jgi:hypothetical protein